MQSQKCSQIAALCHSWKNLASWFLFFQICIIFYDIMFYSCLLSLDCLDSYVLCFLHALILVFHDLKFEFE